MTAERTPRPTDDAPPAPPLTEDEETEEGPSDPSELPEGFDDEESESDPLDDRTGEEDEIDGLEEDLGAEDGWTEDSDPDDQDHGGNITDSEPEDGWTEDSEAAGTDEWEDDLLPGSEHDEGAHETDTGDESGEEPELPSDGELDLEPAALDESEEDDDELEGPEGLADEWEDDAPWRLPPAADPSSVLIDHLGPQDQGLGAIAAWRGRVWAAGGDAFEGDPEPLRPIEDPTLEGVEAQSVAVLPGSDPPVIAFGSVLGGCIVRRALSDAFVRANAWARGRPRVSMTVTATGRALLGRSGDGFLYQSTDAGLEWQPLALPGRCLAAAGDDRCVIAIVACPGEPPRVARSDDGGASFESVPLPLSRGQRIGPDISVSMAGERVLIASEEIGAPLHSEDRGRTFARWDCPTTLAAALDPADPSTAYLSLFHAAEDEGALAMTADGGRTFVTLVELRQLRRLFRLEDRGDSDGENRITSIAVDTETPGRIYLASTAGAFVVAVRPA